MRRFSTFYAGFIITMAVLSSCGRTESKQETIEQDSVTFTRVCLNDTTSYYLNGSDKCSIHANADIEYPKLYLNTEKTEVLKKMFLETVLDIKSDSVTFDKALNLYVDNLLNQYRNNNASIGENTEVDYELVYDYNSSISVTVPFNKDGIVNFCKTETTKKNHRLTMTRHYYYTFDLKTMTRIELDNLFNDEAIANISEMLKKKLMRQLHVKSADELNDIGYYNIDNLVADNNFYFNNEGITWNYLPREISVMDEVKITLEYDSIKGYISERSILDPLIKR